MPCSLPTQRKSGRRRRRCTASGWSLRTTVPGVVPVVVGRAVDAPRLAGPAVVAVAAVGAVEPDLEDRAVVGEQLAELVAVVRRCTPGRAVVRVVAVPGREVDAELQSRAAGRRRRSPGPRRPARPARGWRRRCARCSGSATGRSRRGACRSGSAPFMPAVARTVPTIWSASNVGGVEDVSAARRRSPTPCR